MAGDDVVILYGSLRAGTTLFRLMLNGHPRLQCPGEADFLFDFLSPAAEGGWRYDREALAANRIYQASVCHIPEGLDGAAALAAMIGQIAAGGRLPVLVVHRNLDRVAALLPDAKVIHLKRDPRDIARSSIGMGWAGNVWCGANHWIRTERDWQRGAPLLRQAPLDLTYEALITRPEAELTRVCDHLGLGFEPGMLDVPARSTYARPDPTLAYQWKHKLSGREIRLVETRLGARLTGHGYAPSGLPPLRVGPVRRFGLVLQSKLATFRFAARRHGAGTILLHRLATKFRLPGLRRRLQQRIDARAVAFLK